ncbi:helix-turn-helix domain-containing protein (plasmid) [Rhizobium sp. WYJ-E13]|nr:helix-turn-helix domain-containing protein [Rhizobium sp. WYJ-E13]
MSGTNRVKCSALQCASRVARSGHSSMKTKYPGSFVDVEEVAYLLGYQDANSFYRAFREWENMTPGHWRRIESVSAMTALEQR